MLPARDNQLILDELAAQWKLSGKIIFKNMLKRGAIAERVFKEYFGQYEGWCKRVGMSRQGVNNYRNVYRHFQTLDTAQADRFQSRALYEIAAIGDEIERVGALNWALSFNDGDYVDFQLAYLANPAKTPAYIRAAFAAKDMSKPQAFELAQALNRCPDNLSKTLIQLEVQHAAVVHYILGAYKRRNEPLPDGLESSYSSIEQGGESGAWAFCWYTAKGDEFEIPVAKADNSTVARFKDYRDWLRFEAQKEVQATLERQLYITGSIEVKARVEGGKLILALPDVLRDSVQNDEIEIELSYKVKRFNKLT